MWVDELRLSMFYVIDTKNINRWFLYNNGEAQKCFSHVTRYGNVLKVSEFCRKNKDKENCGSWGEPKMFRGGRGGVEPSAK